MDGILSSPQSPPQPSIRKDSVSSEDSTIGNRTSSPDKQTPVADPPYDISSPADTKLGSRDIHDKTFDSDLSSCSGKYSTPSPVISQLTISDFMNGGENTSRESVGGKGFFLAKMQQAGLPVPPFKCIEASQLAVFEQIPVNADLLKTYIPDITTFKTFPITLSGIKEQINNFSVIEKDKRTQWLNGLSAFISSDDFYPLIKDHPESQKIRERYDQLQQSLPGQAVIVRSSGIREDSYGDAQAGKYDSQMHGKGDILKTCLKVMASGYRPEVCPTGVPQPMAMLVQACIDCSFGGVVMSHSSLQDDTIKVEYAPGQPKSSVAGQFGVTPHRYEIRRTGIDEGYHWTQGDIPEHFVLKKMANGGGFTEQSSKKSGATSPHETLPEQTLAALQRHTVQLENLLGCPVDIEFAIDRQGKLYLVQVRPITRLTGGASFSGEQPENPLIKGTLASEGCCSGIGVTVRNKVDAKSLPKGCIVHAVHGADWMLAPDFLKQVGGFVFQQGGTNDHVAITLRQVGKPCLLAGEHYSEPKAPPSEVTLIAGNVEGTSVAFLLKGDQTAQWQARCSTLNQDYTEALRVSRDYRESEPTFQRPEQGFHWLNQQNGTLLDYFNAGRLLNRCLSPGQAKALSMSPQKSEVMRQLQAEINQLMQDSERFLEGYERFLKLVEDTDQESVSQWLNDLQPLKEQLTALKQQALFNVNNLTKYFTSNQELPSQPVNLEHWLQGCHELQAALQKMSQPRTSNSVSSIHDLIFYVHKNFVEALPLVAAHSGLGIVKKECCVQTRTSTDCKTTINFLQPGTTGLLSKPCQDAISKIHKKNTVLNMPTACIVNVKLGVHVSTVEMFEQAEGGKGRKLRLTLADDFSETYHVQGKLKRFWFLVQSLRSMGLDKDGLGMEIQFNEAAGKITIECPHIKTREAMQEGFVKILSLLPVLINWDMAFEEAKIEGMPSPWNFEKLEKYCKEMSPEQNDWTFKHLLVLHCLSRETMHISSDLLNMFDQEYRIYYQSIEILKEILSPRTITDKNLLVKDIRSRLLSEKGDVIHTELLQHLLMVAPLTLKGIVSDEEIVPKSDIETAVKLCSQNGLILELVPDALKTEEVVLAAVRQNGTVLKYVSDTFRNNKRIVTAAVNSDGILFKHAGRALQNDKDIIKAAVQNNGLALEFIADPLKDRNIIKAAVQNNGMALKFVSAPFVNDRDIIKAAVQNNGLALKFVSDSLKDKDIIMAAVRNNGNALEFVSDPFLKDKDITRTNVQPVDFAVQHANYFKNDEDIIIMAIRTSGFNIRFASKELRSKKSVAMAAVKMDPNAFIFVSDELKDDKGVFQFTLDSIFPSNIYMFAPLRYSGNSIKADESLVMQSVKKSGSVLYFASDALKNNKAIVMAAVTQDGAALNHASIELRNDFTIASIALKSSPEAWNFISDELKNNRHFILKVIKYNVLIIHDLSEILQRDPEIRKLAGLATRV